MNTTSSQSTPTQGKTQNSSIQSDIGQSDTKEIILLAAGLITLVLGLGGVLMYSEDETQPATAPQESAKELSTFQMAKAFATPSPLPATPAPSASNHDVPREDASLHLVTNSLTIQQPQDIDVFFTLNRWTLSDEAKHIIKVSVDERPENWTGTVRIDGHTDTQGTDAYNHALGLRRAESVKAYLLTLGIPENTIHVQSLGKDGAVCQESNPDCFEHNRRAHVAFLSQQVVQHKDIVLSMTPDTLGDSTPTASTPLLNSQPVEESTDEMLVTKEIPGELVAIDPLITVESLP